MDYPFVPSSWSPGISQSLYASIVILLLQFISSLVTEWVRRWVFSFKIREIEIPLSVSISAAGVLGVTISSFLAEEIGKADIAVLVLSVLILLGLVRARYVRLINEDHERQLVLKRLAHAGVYNAYIEPTIDDYKELLQRTNSGFIFLGVGAEKLTRDFDVFCGAMNRSSGSDRPVRFLLVAPDVSWIREGATRRGLGANQFHDRLIQSLSRLKRLREERAVPVEVRFYRYKPLFRLLFINNNECWFGYYSESVESVGQNEFEMRSHSVLVIERPDNRPPDRELFGVMQVTVNNHCVKLWTNEVCGAR